MIVAFDIDGTLANNDHREHLAQAKKWDEFHALQHLDRPLYPTCMTLRALSLEGHSIEIWTARPEKYRAETTQWLNTQGLPFSLLEMRADNDWRKAYIVKLEWWLRRTPGNRPSLVFEDHPETTKLLRAAGATVYQVAEGRYTT